MSGMKISAEKLKMLCLKNDMTLNQILKQAGVSRNAYYSLARKETVLPKSIHAMAEFLDVNPSAFLEEASSEEMNLRLLLKELEQISSRCKHTDRENIRHTLLLLREKPIERLRRALIRGRKFDIYG